MFPEISNSRRRIGHADIPIGGLSLKQGEMQHHEGIGRAEAHLLPTFILVLYATVRDLLSAYDPVVDPAIRS